MRWTSYAIDTVLLAAAVTLAGGLRLVPFADRWLTTKLALVVLYVVLGSLALKRAPTPSARRACLLAALLAFVAVVVVARDHGAARWALAAGTVVSTILRSVAAMVSCRRRATARRRAAPVRGGPHHQNLLGGGFTDEQIKAGARLALFALLALASVAAAGAPDFSGQWKLNAAKSTNLGMMAAVQQTLTITQTPAELKLVEASDFQGQKSGRTVRYDLKGAPVMNEGGMGGQAETVAKWDGGKLVVTWTTEGAVAGTKNVAPRPARWRADGATMTVESTCAAPTADGDGVRQGQVTPGAPHRDETAASPRSAPRSSSRRPAVGLWAWRTGGADAAAPAARSRDAEPARRRLVGARDGRRAAARRRRGAGRLAGLRHRREAERHGRLAREAGRGDGARSIRAASRRGAPRRCAQVAVDRAGGRAGAQVEPRRGERLDERQLVAASEVEDRKLDLAGAGARLEKARRDAAVIETDLTYTVIRSPITGTVASVTTQKGETVAASFTAPTFVTIIGDDALQLVALVDETDIGAVALGNPVTFTVEAWPAEEFTGRVERIAPQRHDHLGRRQLRGHDQRSSPARAAQARHDRQHPHRARPSARRWCCPNAGDPARRPGPLRVRRGGRQAGAPRRHHRRAPGRPDRGPRGPRARPTACSLNPPAPATESTP